MRSSVPLALVSGLLTYALTTAPDTSLNAVNATLQWTPDLPYPAGYSAATCPLDPGPNPFSTLEVLERKERSFTTATHLRRRNEICRQIIHGNLEHFPRRVSQTEQVLLFAGVTYVFSWAMNVGHTWVTAWKFNDGTATIIQGSRIAGRGTMTLSINQMAHVHFRMEFTAAGPYPDVSGEYALFQIGPG